VRRHSKKKLLEITIEEVEAANTAQKSWVAIRGKVYDLTKFVDKHPGGSDFLLASVGRDATAMYESIHEEKNTRVLKWVTRNV
jgi:cytochrome b involved in lipid metabolism